MDGPVGAWGRPTRRVTGNEQMGGPDVGGGGGAGTVSRHRPGGGWPRRGRRGGFGPLGASSALAGRTLGSKVQVEDGAWHPAEDPPLGLPSDLDRVG